MKSREELLKSPAYWFENEQNALYRVVQEYMEREKINQTELAERLNVSKGYISQILSGNFNYTLKKLIEIALNLGVIPCIQYRDIESVIKSDKRTALFFDYNEEFSDFKIVSKSNNAVSMSSKRLSKKFSGNTKIVYF